MNAKELRIGNYLLNNNCIVRVNHIMFSDYCIVKTKQNNEITARYELIKPIPLTEEWLLKLGFASCQVSKELGINMPYYAKEGVLLFYNSGRTKFELSDYHLGYGEMRGGKYFAVCTKWVKHVHEVQNAYFDNAGTELTIK